MARSSWRQRHQLPAEPALPAVRAISASYGNAVQMGIPMAAAMFGEAGLGLHLMLVSVHGLILLSLLTALVEMDLARSKARQLQQSACGRCCAARCATPSSTRWCCRCWLGLAWNLLGLGLPGLVDEVLQLLGSAVVPLCLVLIGLSLAYYGLQGSVRGALGVHAAQAAGPAGAGAGGGALGLRPGRACRCRYW